MKKTVSATHLARVLGITTRRANQLVEDKVLARTGGEFDLEDAVRRYCEWLRRDEETRTERRKLLQAQTLATALRAKRQTGALMTREEVRQKLEPIIEGILTLKGAASLLHRTLASAVGPERATLIAYELYDELTGRTKELRDKAAATFADLPETNLDDELKRLGVEAPTDGDDDE